MKQTEFSKVWKESLKHYGVGRTSERFAWISKKTGESPLTVKTAYLKFLKSKR